MKHNCVQDTLLLPKEITLTKEIDIIFSCCLYSSGRDSKTEKVKYV